MPTPPDTHRVALSNQPSDVNGQRSSSWLRHNVCASRLIYLCADKCVIQRVRLLVRRRRAFAITETELKLIAAAANIGDSESCHTG